MFWSKKNKNTKKKKNESGANAGKSLSVGMSESQRIREEALANARKAREHIGEETLDRIAAAMTKKQQSITERAKAQINNCESDRVAAEILAMLDER